MSEIIASRTPSVQLTSAQQQQLRNFGLPQAQTASWYGVLELEVTRRTGDIAWAAGLQSMPQKSVLVEIAQQQALANYIALQKFRIGQQRAAVEAALLSATVQSGQRPGHHHARSASGIQPMSDIFAETVATLREAGLRQRDIAEHLDPAVTAIHETFVRKYLAEGPQPGVTREESLRRVAEYVTAGGMAEYEAAEELTSGPDSARLPLLAHAGAGEANTVCSTRPTMPRSGKRAFAKPKATATGFSTRSRAR